MVQFYDCFYVYWLVYSFIFLLNLGKKIFFYSIPDRFWILRPPIMACVYKTKASAYHSCSAWIHRDYCTARIDKAHLGLRRLSCSLLCAIKSCEYLLTRLLMCQWVNCRVLLTVVVLALMEYDRIVTEKEKEYGDMRLSCGYTHNILIYYTWK